jgi:Flp pilus assembly protein TadD
MSADTDLEERRILPRWRKSSRAIRTGELTSIRIPPPQTPISTEELDTRLEDWKRERTSPFAVDLLSAAVVLGQPKPAMEAAREILNSLADSPLHPAASLAKRVLGVGEPTALELPDAECAATAKDAAHTVRSLRRSLRSDPRNAIAWVDLARCYAVLGLPEQANLAMGVGLYLSRAENRFVLRSATRLLVHLHDPQAAHSILTKSPLVEGDPWILAAEIAVSSVMGRSSRRIRRARSLVDSSSFSNLSISELAAALGTLEVLAGDVRGAKKLFRRALLSPTDNSIAQAEWASKQLNTRLVEPSHLTKAFTFEAQALNHYYSAEWELALSAGKNWLADEPFSSRPAELASFIAAVPLADYSTAESLLTCALTANADDPILLNNLAFSLASQGRARAAQEVIERIDGSTLSRRQQIVVTATRGLISYRSNQLDEGSEGYSRALAMATSENLPLLRAMAMAFWAREETIVGGSKASALIGEASELARKLSPFEERVVTSILAQFAAHPE